MERTRQPSWPLHPLPPAARRRHRPGAPAPSLPPLALRSYGLSDRGRVRTANEDCFAVAELVRTMTVHHSNLPQPRSATGAHHGHIFVVADGVGGNIAGEVASDLSVRTVEAFLLNALRRFTNLKPDEEPIALRDLQTALAWADSRIFAEAATHPEWHGMGTTLTLALAVNWRLLVAHAGDSRCYLFSGGDLRQLTQDHTVAAEMVSRGLLARGQVPGHPWRHVVTNLLGGHEPGVRVELHSLDLHPDDVILLCSDGLTEMVPDDVIAAVLREEPDPRVACERLVGEANRCGGQDNITVVVAHVGASSVG